MQYPFGDLELDAHGLDLLGRTPALSVLYRIPDALPMAPVAARPAIPAEGDMLSRLYVQTGHALLHRGLCRPDVAVLHLQRARAQEEGAQLRYLGRGEFPILSRDHYRDPALLPFAVEPL